MNYIYPICNFLFQNFWWVIRGPSEIATLNLRSLVVPSDKWGPALQENCTTQLPQEINTHPENGMDTDSAALNHREDRCFVSENTSYSNGDEKVIFTWEGDSYIQETTRQASYPYRFTYQCYTQAAQPQAMTSIIQRPHCKILTLFHSLTSRLFATEFSMSLSTYCSL